MGQRVGCEEGVPMEDTYAALQKKMNFTLEMACFCTFWAVFLSMSSPEDIEFSA